jgi:hypothetical protein
VEDCVTELKQVSMLDWPQVTANARYGVAPSAEEVAQRHHLIPERSFDDLAYFDLFAVKVGDVVLGFRSYFQTKRKSSVVAVWPRDCADAAKLIAEIAGVPLIEVEIFREDW